MKDEMEKSKEPIVNYPVDMFDEPWNFGDMFKFDGKLKKLSKIELYANGNGKLTFGGANYTIPVDHGRTRWGHYYPTPAERIRRLAMKIKEAESKTMAKRYADELIEIAEELED